MTNFYGQYIGFGAGGAAAASVPFQGSAYGYVCGGGSAGSSNPNDQIERYSFTSDGGGSDVGDLSAARGGNNCTQSATVAYTVGGGSGSGGWPANLTIIDKFTYASGGNAAAQTATLLANKSFGSTSCTQDFGYHAGSEYDSALDVIEKWSQVADTNSEDVGDLLAPKGRHAGATNIAAGFGYSMGSWTSSGLDVIERYSFATGTQNAGNVGDLTSARGGVGQCSDINGYVSGGYEGSTSNVIDKFSFATDTQDGATNGTLSTGRYWGSGTSSTTDGYTAGGDGSTSRLDKFSFATGTQNAGTIGATDIPRGNTGSQGFHF